MKVAAATAIAALAHEPVPDEMAMAYGDRELKFGREYILPKPFDKRLLTSVTPAIVRTAMESGVARHPIDDFDHYGRYLEEIMCANDSLIKYLAQTHDSCACNPYR